MLVSSGSSSDNGERSQDEARAPPARSPVIVTLPHHGYLHQASFTCEYCVIQPKRVYISIMHAKAGMYLVQTYEKRVDTDER